MINFDEPVERRNTGSYKWDYVEKLFGKPELLPLWVADMDLPCCDEIVKSLAERAKHPVYGYTLRSENHFISLCKWLETRHNWAPDPGWCLRSPSLITTLSLCIREFSEPEDGVIIQPPVYHPFYEVVELNGRKLLTNDLERGEDGRYAPDLKGFEKLCREGAKIFILCSPHNPVGRVWTENELREMSKMCHRYGVVILSDEIHCDLVYEGFRHIPLASLSKEYSMNSVTLISPAKTFNIAGLQESAAITENPDFRERLAKQIYTLGLNISSIFGTTAFEAAYSRSDGWYNYTRKYLSANREKVVDFVNTKMDNAFVYAPEATYLAWIDFEKTGFSESELDDLLINKAKVALDPGRKFSSRCGKFKRLNFACSAKTLENALNSIQKAIQK